MAKAKYTGDYLIARKSWAVVVANGEAYCHEPTCLMPSRHIAAGSRWDLSHDTTGTQILGPSHHRCNRSEGATRGNKQRGRRFLQL